MGGCGAYESGGRLVKSDFRSHSGSHQRSAWIQNPKKNPGAGWVGGFKSDFTTHSGSHQSSAWIQNPSSSRVWQKIIMKENVGWVARCRVGGKV